MAGDHLPVIVVSALRGETVKANRSRQNECVGHHPAQ